MRQGVTIGRIAGVEIRVDWSLLIIFLLIVASLGAGLLPSWHPDWGAGLVWTISLLAALLFFASVLVHELAHALVGRRQGALVPRITLFVFGGMSHLEREPPSWRGELLMAAVGPLASLAIGAVCLLLVGGTGDLAWRAEDPRASLAALAPLPTLLLWLGQINILLGLFNLVPGFPLDGGRVLRALLWGLTGDRRRATGWAAGLGQGFAWLLIGLGLAMMLGIRVPLFGSGLIPGLWLAFIGWFLNNAALMSYRQLLVRESLTDVPVSRLMQTELVSVGPELGLEELVNRHVLHTGQRAFPVVRDGVLIGLVGLADLRRVGADAWPRAMVRDVMIPRERLATISPTVGAAEALQRLSEAGYNQLPVVERDELLGLVTREGVLRWLSLKGGLGDQRGQPERA